MLSGVVQGNPCIKRNVTVGIRFWGLVMGKVLSAFTAKAIEMAKDVTLTERISRGVTLGRR